MLRDRGFFDTMMFHAAAYAAADFSLPATLAKASARFAALRHRLLLSPLRHIRQRLPLMILLLHERLARYAADAAAPATPLTLRLFTLLLRRCLFFFFFRERCCFADAAAATDAACRRHATLPACHTPLLFSWHNIMVHVNAPMLISYARRGVYAPCCRRMEIAAAAAIIAAAG